MIVGTVYRPPNGDKTVFNTKLTDQIENIQNIMKFEMYICGDFNINLFQNENADVIDQIQDMESLDLHQKITTPTLIDHFYTNSSHIDKHGTLDLNISDHKMIFVINKKHR